MKAKRNVEQIVAEIQYEHPDFMKENFLDVSAKKIISIYNFIRDNNFLFINNFCTDDMSEYIKEHKDSIFMINSDIDHIAIQNKVITDYRKNNGFEEIDLNIHIYYIDYMYNNKENYHPIHRKYIEKAYEFTFRANNYINQNINEFKCDRCGAIMKKITGFRFLECDYCKNVKPIDYNDWKISRIIKLDV